MSIHLGELFGLATVDYSGYGVQPYNEQAQRNAQVAAANRWLRAEKGRWLDAKTVVMGTPQNQSWPSIWGCEYCGAEHSTTVNRCTCCGAHKRG